MRRSASSASPGTRPPSASCTHSEPRMFSIARWRVNSEWSCTRTRTPASASVAAICEPRRPTPTSAAVGGSASASNRAGAIIVSISRTSVSSRTSGVSAGGGVGTSGSPAPAGVSDPPVTPFPIAPLRRSSHMHGRSNLISRGRRSPHRASDTPQTQERGESVSARGAAAPVPPSPRAASAMANASWADDGTHIEVIPDVAASPGTVRVSPTSAQVIKVLSINCCRSKDWSQRLKIILNFRPNLGTNARCDSSSTKPPMAPTFFFRGVAVESG